MKRTWINLAVDAALAVLAWGLLVTGLLMALVMPPGTGHDRVLLLDMDRHDWGDVHFWIAAAAAGLLLIHAWLHWSWICTMTRRLVCGGSGAAGRPLRVLLGVGMLALLPGLTAGLLWWASANLVVNDSRPIGQGRRAIAPITADDEQASNPDDRLRHRRHDHASASVLRLHQPGAGQGRASRGDHHLP